MFKYFFGVVVGLSLLLVTQPAAALRVVSYNVLNYEGDRINEMRIIFNALQADVIVLQEVGSLSAATTFLTSVLNSPSGPGGYAIGTFTDDFPLTNNALFFRTAALAQSGSGTHLDLATTPRETDRWRLTLNGYSGSGAEIYFYGMHLKAGSTASDEDERTTAATLIRANTNALPAGTQFILLGDMNLQASTEGAYQQFTSLLGNTNGRTFDPIASPGNWSGNAAFAAIHTQSPHANNAGAPPGATAGGMDDRFDFQLISAALQDGAGIDYVTGTYRAFGNDGLHFNDDINDAPTIPEGAAVANALHGASDHLPVVADYQVPPRISNDPAVDLGKAIVGTPAIGTLNVMNAGDVATFGFVAPLQYTLNAAPGIFSAPGGTITEFAGGGANQHSITLNTPTEGSYFGTVTINSNAVDFPVSQATVFGQIVRHAQPSLDSGSVVTVGAVDFGQSPPGGFANQAVQIYNLGAGSTQAGLAVQNVQIIGGSGFATVGFSPTVVGTTPLTLTFSFDDPTPGVKSALVAIDVADEAGVQGGIQLSALVLNLTATVTANGDCNSNGQPDAEDIAMGVSFDLNLNGIPDECECPTPFVRGEINGDGSVDIGDAIALLNFLFSGGAAPNPAAAGDVNGDGSTDVGDVIYLLAFQFSGGPQPPAPFPNPGCP
ncbi:MAG: dockerin type I domain-containing protein [Planctomycetota bacterium]